MRVVLLRLFNSTTAGKVCLLARGSDTYCVYVLMRIRTLHATAAHPLHQSQPVLGAHQSQHEAQFTHLWPSEVSHRLSVSDSQPVCLSLCLSVCLSVGLSVCVFVCLSICLPAC